MWKWLIVILLAVGFSGYWGYNFVISQASDLMVNQIVSHIDDEELNQIMDDPTIQHFITTVDVDHQSDLPFQNKEDALKTIMKEFSISEINDVTGKAQRGELHPSEIEKLLEERLSNEEIEALKIIAIKELQNR
ncbi:hypothetical protein JCM9140_3343 [Halalkalibacter wakoensis JCM 9140]|uniref:Uncharacterized protein n=1 Tax=Halalkalibacter wakoensis JCM 9140 TaxID=1236970 RepID=W4Q5I3_9BACI|nr:hypothetical protein [Halalkalibacter wakoensis]GAE27215.1 hypothetical protein JCM9140_3343 [Halalkalibacter wakoensis JCM 9140]